MIKSAVITDKGRIRENNEDAFFVDKDRGIFIVADGMGGHNAGEVASKLAVEFIGTYLSQQTKVEKEIRKAILEAVLLAHEEIKKKANEDPFLKGMGTTVVLGYLKGKDLFICNVGDSRAYLIRDKEIVRLTEDHSMAANFLKSGLIQ
ncbi:MAG: protein phosphatase 2C domain-containing protein [Deltaproteobacteria bacterium]|nr:protein phosphatase 2C domain-containing protein [Deltaproteobacteria bacterium]